MVNTKKNKKSSKNKTKKNIIASIEENRFPKTKVNRSNIMTNLYEKAITEYEAKAPKKIKNHQKIKQKKI